MAKKNIILIIKIIYRSRYSFILISIGNKSIESVFLC